MSVAVVGLGLGYSLSKILAAKGYKVVGVDLDPGAWKYPRIDLHMGKWLARHNKPVHFTNDYSMIKGCDFIFIFVNTPLDKGRLSMKNVYAAISSASEIEPDAQYVILSTLPVGGMKNLEQRFPSLDLVYAPPMVKRFDFLETFIHPPSGWQLFGAHEPPVELMRMYRDLQPHVKQYLREPEIVERAKLLTNVMLATKIIMANAFRSSFPKYAGEVCAIVMADPRIGEGYFIPGGPAAGPCLPRDMIEMEAASEGDLNLILQLLNDVNKSYELVK